MIQQHMSVDDLVKRCGSMYKLVVLAAKRAKELADGSPSLVDFDHKKVTSVALEEIRQGRVSYKGSEVEAAAKSKKTKSRGAKAKTKKRG